MGFRKGRKTYRLTFEDPELAGLEVVANGVSMGRLLEMAGLAELAGGNFKPQDIAKIDDLLELFSSCIVSWNLEDEEGAPVPSTLGGLKSQDTDFVLDMLMAWLDAVVNVSAPLKRPSSSGDQSLAASLPMDPS